MIIQDDAYHNPENLQNIINSYIPSSWELFSESVLYGLRTTWYQENLDEMVFEATSHETAISEAIYESSDHYREGIEWYEGMTMGQAEVLAENNDRNTHYALLTKNIDFFSMKGAQMLGGMLVGSLPDPLNYVPFIGLSQRVLRSGAMINSVKGTAQAIGMRTGGSTALTRTLTDIVDPMIGAGIANVAIASKRSKFQEEHDLKMILMDMAIAGGIGTGIASLKGVRSKMRKIREQRHSDRIAMAMEQMEAGEGLNLKPHPHKGWNYENSPNTLIKSPNGTAHSNSTVRIMDDNYLNIETITSEGLSDTAPVIQESLDTANALGYKGIFVSDNVLGDALTSETGTQLDVVIADIGDTTIHIERIPESKGAIISDTLTEADGVSWEHVDTNNQFKYDETQTIIAEDVQTRIKQSIGQFTDMAQIASKAIDDVGVQTKAITQRVQKFGDSVMDAANCIIKNG